MLIKTTKRHAMMLETPPIGRYPFEITKVVTKPNKKQDGHNVVYTFTFRDEDFNGKTLDVYCPAGHDFGIANMLQIHKAITGTEDAECEFDPEKDHVGATLVGEVDHEMYNGSPQARIVGFLPADTPTNSPF